MRGFAVRALTIRYLPASGSSGWRVPTIIEIDIRDGVPMVLHEEPHGDDQEAQARWWMPLTQEYAHEDEAAFWGPLVPPE